MSPTDVIGEIVDILVAGIVDFAQGIGTGISTTVTSMMFTGTGENQTLSPFFVAVLVFAGIALVVGLTTKIFNWLGSLGAN